MRLGKRGVVLLSMALIGVFFLGGSAQAAKFTVATEDGSEPEPNSNSEVQEGFNPDISCSAGDGGTIHDLLLCLLDQIVTLPAPCVNLEIVGGQQPGGINGGQSTGQQHAVLQNNPSHDCPNDPNDREDFIVRYFPTMPPYGLEILTTDYDEIEKITLKENDASIQWTQLLLGKSHRRIRIADIVENPSGRGAIYLTINYTTMVIPTLNTRTAVELTAAIVRAIRANGFDFYYERPYIWVTYDRRRNQHIANVSFRSTDPAVVSSDIGILPPGPSVPESEIHPIPMPDPIMLQMQSSQ